jgi:hypothetical protein
MNTHFCQGSKKTNFLSYAVLEIVRDRFRFLLMGVVGMSVGMALILLVMALLLKSAEFEKNNGNARASL